MTISDVDDAVFAKNLEKLQGFTVDIGRFLEGAVLEGQKRILVMQEGIVAV